MAIPAIAAGVANVGGKLLGSVGKKTIGSLKKEVSKIGNKREYINNFVEEYSGEQLKNNLNENNVIANNTGNLDILDMKEKKPTNTEDILEIKPTTQEEENEEDSKLPNPLSKAKLPNFNRFPRFGGISLLILIILFLLFSIKKVETADGEETTRLKLILQTFLGNTEFSGGTGGSGSDEDDSLSDKLLDKYKDTVLDGVGIPWMPGVSIW